MTDLRERKHRAEDEKENRGEREKGGDVRETGP